MRIGILGGRGFLGSEIRKHAFANNLHIEEINSINHPENELSLSRPLFDVIINCMMKMPERNRAFEESPVIENSCFSTPMKLITLNLRKDGLVINTSTYLQRFLGKRNNPIGIYAKWKQELTNSLEEKAKKGDFRVIDLYIFTLYGELDKPFRLIPTLVKKITDQEPINLTNGEQLIELNHVSDAAHTILELIKSESDASYYECKLWRGDYVSIKELVVLMEQISGRTLNVNWGGVPYSGLEMFYPWEFVLPNPTVKYQGINLSNGLKMLFGTHQK
jgi:hypothetical protein